MKRILIGFVVVAIVAVLLAYGVFRGYFDKGRFEIKQTVRSSDGRLAIVAERSDQAALTSYIYFVLVTDHLLLPPELRKAYYGKAPVFEAASSCVTAHWKSPNELVIACKDGMVGSDHIEFQAKQSGTITIVYEGIPTK